MSHLNPGLLSTYNSLMDKHLTGYFNNTRIRRHLVKVGLITRSGNIVPDKEYKYSMMRRYHERHMRECLAQAIFNKVLDIERHHQIQIKKKLEDFAQRERVNKIKVERSRRYNGDVIPLRSPRPPSGPKNGQTWHSGPEGEQSESSESPSSSRPNTAPEKIQRPVRLQPINSGSTHRPSQFSSPRASSGDKEHHGSSALDKEGVRHVTMSKFSTGVSPYRLPVINSFVTPVPPPSKRKARSFKSAPNESTRGRKLRPTTAPSVPVVTKESIFQKTSMHCNVSVTMVLCCKTVNLSHNDIDFRHEVKVFQQHCGGENICVYKGKLKEGEPFRFISRRHRGFPFSLTFYINGLQVERLSSCCEFRHRKGTRLGGKHGHFSFVSVDGASPCYRCIIAMGLDKKPTPPQKGKEEDKEEGFFSSSLEMAENFRDKEEETVKQDSQPNIQASQGYVDGDHRDSEENDTIHEEQEEKGKDGYDEDFEADDERGDDETDESEPHARIKQTPSPSNEERDSHSESKEGRGDDSREIENDEKGIYTDSEAEEENNTREKTPSLSSRSASFSSNNSNEDSCSEAEDVKETVADRSSSCVSKAEWTEEDKTGQEVEEYIQVEHDNPGQSNLKEMKASEEPMEAASEDDDEAIFEANIQTTPVLGEERLKPQDSALDEASQEGSLRKAQTGMAEGFASDDAENNPKESAEEAELERAKSVQEKLAKAIMKETQCDSEPELSDTSTEEEEEQTCTGVEMQVSLLQSPYIKAEITDEPSVESEVEGPVEDIGDEINTNMEEQQVGDTLELPQEPHKPSFAMQGEETEEMPTETELQEHGNNVEESKMEGAATETGEREMEDPDEAHAEDTDYNFTAVDNFKIEESKSKAEENETRTEDTENEGYLIPEEKSNVFQDEGKTEDELSTLNANKTEEYDAYASENYGSDDTEKREILEESAEGGAEDTDEKDNGTVGWIQEMTEVVTEAPTEDEDNLVKLNTVEQEDRHTEQEEKLDATQHGEAETREEDDKFSIEKTSVQENRVDEESIDNTDMEKVREKNNEVTKEPVEEAASVTEKENVPIGIQPIMLEEQKEPDDEDKAQIPYELNIVETEAKNEEEEETEGNIELKENESESQELETKEKSDGEHQVQLENNTEFVDKNMETGLEREIEAVCETEVEQTVSEAKNSRSNFSETAGKSDAEDEDKDQTEEVGDENAHKGDRYQSQTEDEAVQAQDTENNEGDVEQEAEETIPGRTEDERGDMQVIETEDQEETKAEQMSTEGEIERVSFKSGDYTEIFDSHTRETEEEQKLQNEANTTQEASMENENEETVESPEEREETKQPPEGSTDGINNPGPPEVAALNIIETKSELEAQDEQHDEVQPLRESDPDNLPDTQMDGMEPKVSENKEDESEANVEEYCMAEEPVMTESLSTAAENRVETSELTVDEGQDLSIETKGKEIEIEGKVKESEHKGDNDVGDVTTDQDEESTDTSESLRVAAQSVGEITTNGQGAQCEALILEEEFSIVADEENPEAVVKEVDNDLTTSQEEKDTEKVAEVLACEEESLHEGKADSQIMATDVRDEEDPSEVRSNHSKDEESGEISAAQGTSDGGRESRMESDAKTEDQGKDEAQSSVPYSEAEHRGRNAET